jgi:hypothetical protein
MKEVTFRYGRVFSKQLQTVDRVVLPLGCWYGANGFLPKKELVMKCYTGPWNWTHYLE